MIWKFCHGINGSFHVIPLPKVSYHLQYTQWYERNLQEKLMVQKQTNDLFQL